MINNYGDKKDHIEEILHHAMALVGGFLGGYAVLTKADFLGNAQTSNILYMVMALLGNNFTEVLIRIIGILLYVLGAFTFVFLKNKTRLKLKRISILVDLVAIIILGFIPSDFNPIIGLYPIFFAMSLQWNCFPGSYGYNSSSIFSTNNLRQVSLSIAEYLCDGRKKNLHKAYFFAGTLIFFHIGVAVSYFSVKKFDVRGVWMGGIIILLILPILYKEEKINEEILLNNKNEGNYAKNNCKSA